MPSPSECPGFRGLGRTAGSEKRIHSDPEGGRLSRDGDPLGGRHSDRGGAVGRSGRCRRAHTWMDLCLQRVPHSWWCSVACLWSCVPCFTEFAKLCCQPFRRRFLLGDSHIDLGWTRVGRSQAGLSSIRWQWGFNPRRCDECESQRGDDLWSTHFPV